MKKKKEIISLNQAKAEFSGEMTLDERLELLDSSALQQVKGGTICPLHDSSSDGPCNCFSYNDAPDRDDGPDGCNCVGVGTPPGWGGGNSCRCNIDMSDFCPENCRLMYT